MSQSPAALLLACLLIAFGAASAPAAAADKPRARALGIPFDGKPGALNAITDVVPVAVGYSTLIEGSGEHAVRTGVTAILPRGRGSVAATVFAGVFSLNAFSTANPAANQSRSFDVHALANGQLNPLFLATVQSVEESIINALVAAETMTGVRGATVPAIDTGELRSILRRFGRLEQ